MIHEELPGWAKELHLWIAVITLIIFTLIAVFYFIGEGFQGGNNIDHAFSIMSFCASITIVFIDVIYLSHRLLNALKLT